VTESGSGDPQATFRLLPSRTGIATVDCILRHYAGRGAAAVARHERIAQYLQALSALWREVAARPGLLQLFLAIVRLVPGLSLFFTMVGPMSKRLYKFISAQYGLCNLINRRLKLSTLADLNDPFDLYAIDTTNPQIRQAVEMLMADFKTTTGLLCFSRNWDNLLMWSHYGASHTGLCLGFEIPDDDGQGNPYDMDVHYRPSLLEIRCREDVNFTLVNRLLRTKHESWSYEQEVRVFVGLNDPPDEKGLHWMSFGPTLQLKEVIIGAVCNMKISEQVQEAARTYGDAVKCCWAGMSPDAFLLVKQGQPPWWHASVK
jgi:hypothetical protein